MTCLLSMVQDVPLDSFWAFVVPSWFVDAERRFPMMEDSANSISAGLWPPELADVTADRGEWQMSRTLTADRRRAGTIFCALFEDECVRTRITLPGYDMLQ